MPAAVEAAVLEAAVAAVLGSTAAGVRVGQTQGGACSVGVGGVSGFGAGRMIDPAVRDRRSRKWKRWERGAPMELWQMDIVGGFPLADGTSAKALTGVDDHSRFCVSARLMARERTRAVCDGLRAAISSYGAPVQILTDNGKVFTGRFNHPPVEVLFDAICRENGDRAPADQPRSPTTTGRSSASIAACALSYYPGQSLSPHSKVAQGALDGVGRGLQHPPAASVAEHGYSRGPVQ